jgi:6-phosphofructokinase
MLYCLINSLHILVVALPSTIKSDENDHASVGDSTRATQMFPTALDGACARPTAHGLCHFMSVMGLVLSLSVAPF